MKSNVGHQILSTSLLPLAFTLSRFRFWIYTGGTFVLGVALGMENWQIFFSPLYYLYLFYFFFPANLFIYGINDYWDEETDRQNPKKVGKEHKLKANEHRKTLLLLTIFAALSLALFVTQDRTEQVIFLIFLFLAYFYSAPPLRFKQHPVLDFSANMLYIMPGIFGYYLAAGQTPPLLLVIAGYLHISAMHIFSAIPDIRYDRAAGITTTAVWLGKRSSLVVCTAFWILFSLLVILLAGLYPLSFLVVIYPLFPAVLLFRKEVSIDRLYWYLPYVNTALGGLAFAVFTLLKMPAVFPPFW